MRRAAELTIFLLLCWLLVVFVASLSSQPAPAQRGTSETTPKEYTIKLIDPHWTHFDVKGELDTEHYVKVETVRVIDHYPAGAYPGSPHPVLLVHAGKTTQRLDCASDQAAEEIIAHIIAAQAAIREGPGAAKGTQ